MITQAARAWTPEAAPHHFSEPLTLLELVNTVAEFASNEEEVIATVAHLINTRAVTLVGSFRGSNVRVS
jgi:hypothetical protein